MTFPENKSGSKLSRFALVIRSSTAAGPSAVGSSTFTGYNAKKMPTIAKPKLTVAKIAE